ncbi:MAG: glycosyltransferase family 2 protein [Chitinophagaceae bacterium]
MRPIAITKYAQECWNALQNIPDVKEKTKVAYQQLRKTGNPDVSIVIPAYNEEENIVQTLYSLCQNITTKAVEIIVVNNNSKDNTANLVDACGVTCILETKQGITNARNAGLAKATGTYVLNADADSIYPMYWVEEMVKPFDNDAHVCSVYGRFSFIPVGNTGRLMYFFYEYIADFMRWINKHIKDEAVNVYGFNSGFRREQGLQVDGFNHPPYANEDGWLALKLRNKGFGKLYYVTNIKALVWTTDRRIQIDGGIVKATIRRIKRMFFKGER